VLLYVCYDYFHELHRSPKDWQDVFDFLKYSKTKGSLKEAAFEAAKAASGAKSG